MAGEARLLPQKALWTPYHSPAGDVGTSGWKTFPVNGPADGISTTSRARGRACD